MDREERRTARPLTVTVASFVNGNNAGIPPIFLARMMEALSPPEGWNPPFRTVILGTDRLGNDT
ncbi:hypothetical protein [Rathayibacter sp. VKM Ac-2760]|uniref:hypothetical protein n=1 Tax=Rathayibacter sp. VKM Ac-2760 TaxID=2609253 RepID=UPI001317F1ED|nr:hypothetical protein [Rathayibacter sp. VKM Ac-2760]QHC58765.1 hypothetical protein GSU72_09530 [Rathayibacter sp. VKM Ac-2760]